MKKFILNCESKDLGLAVRVARWLDEHPEKQDAILEYEDGGVFFVRRNKTSISVFKSDHWEKESQ